MNVDTELFRVVEQGGKRLIMPHHSAAVSNDGWTNENLWLRSRVECIRTGDTISQGFGKFFNLGMGPDGIRIEAHDIVEAVRNGERVVATHKYDGSCLIRSVYKGEVIFRTRGSLSYQFHDGAENEMGVFLDKYPRLLDATWMTDKSLIFEWVTPDFQIVVKYEDLDIVLIAGVDHGHRHYSHLRYLTVGELDAIALEGNLHMMEYFVIDSLKAWFDFYHEVINHKEIEGYVIRLGEDEDRLVKVKSQPYLVKHGLKSNLSYKSLVEFWLQHGRGSGEEIVRQLERMYDEEVVMWALPFVVEVEEGIEAWERAYKDVHRIAVTSQHWSRKDFAVEMQKKFADDRLLFSLAMILWQNPDCEVEDKLIRNFMQRFDKSDGKPDFFAH